MLFGNCIRFDGIRNIFSLHFNNNDNNDMHILEEHVVSVSIFNSFLVLNISSAEYSHMNITVNKKYIEEKIKDISAITFNIYDRSGELTDSYIFSGCKLIEISDLTYNYGYNMNDIIYNTVIISYDKKYKNTSGK